jgi:hypothetical protein
MWCSGVCPAPFAVNYTARCTGCNSQWHIPGLDVVSAYVDQRPFPFGQGPAGARFSTMKGDDETRWDGRELIADQWALREEEFGVPAYSTIAEALRCGGDKLAVDAVLLIGEHGNYEKSEYGQTKYPRYEFFKEITDVFREDGRSVPVFNDSKCMMTTTMQLLQLLSRL